MKIQIVAALAAAALVGVAVGLFADDEKGAAAETPGIILSVDADKGTLVVRGVRDGDSGEKPFNLSRGVKVLVEGKDAKLADLKPGMRVNLKVEEGTGDVVGITLVAIGRRPVERGEREGDRPREGEGPRRGPTVRALIRSVDSAKNSLTATIVEREGETIGDRTLEVAPNVEIAIDGRASKLADLPAGSNVWLVMSADRKTVLGVRAEGPMQRGRVKAVDAGKNTITLAAGDETPEQTLQLGPDTRVQIGERPAKLDDVKPVQRRLTIDRKTVIAVIAFPGERREGAPRPDGERPGVKRPDGERPDVKKPDGEK
jgi:hypothetical protein